MPAHDFVTLDVFTAQPFGGNPLAVFPDARGLDGARMQAIAAEFNLSETVFLLPPPPGSEAIATVRIFTPVNELPFAGHPNVGAAFHVASVGGLYDRDCGDAFVFDELAGPVHCRVDRAEGRLTTSIRAPRALTLIEEVDRALLARCAGLEPGAIVGQPMLASVGLPFALAEVASLDALAAAQPDLAAFREADAAHPRAEDHFNLYLYVRDTADPARVRTRMFGPLVGVTEDAATGSAAAVLGAYLHRADRCNGAQRYAITQGVEMGRPSDITVEADPDGVSVGGPCVPMQRGVLTL